MYALGLILISKEQLDTFWVVEKDKCTLEFIFFAR